MMAWEAMARRYTILCRRERSSLGRTVEKAAAILVLPSTVVKEKLAGKVSSMVK
jgi:hypothetical protein